MTAELVTRDDGLAPDPSFDAALNAATGALVPGAIRPAVDLEVIIPAYNEERRLPATLRSLVAYLGTLDRSCAIVVVDNGSVDYTSEVADSARHSSVPIYVLGCARPGKGSAVRRGLLSGRSRYVGFVDADGSTPIETLEPVLRHLDAGIPAVVASRHAAGAAFAVEQSALRRLGGDFFRLLSASVVRGVADTQCGFKFFRGDVIRPVAAQATIDGFAFDLEMLAHLQRRGHRIHEVPVRWSDAEGSTFKPLKHGPQAVADTVRIARAVRRHTSIDLANAPASLHAVTTR